MKRVYDVKKSYCGRFAKHTKRESNAGFKEINEERIIERMEELKKEMERLEKFPRIALYQRPISSTRRSPLFEHIARSAKNSADSAKMRQTPHLDAHGEPINSSRPATATKKAEKKKRLKVKFTRGGDASSRHDDENESHLDHLAESFDDVDDEESVHEEENHAASFLHNLR